MKKKRIISLVINVLIVLSTIVAWGFMFVPLEGELMASGWASLRYFTILSNIFCAITSIFMVVVNIKQLKNLDYKTPKYITLLRYISTVSVTVTFITVVIFLGPVWEITGQGSYFSLFAKQSFALHFSTPVLSIINITNFETDYKFNKKEMLLGLAPTVLYSIIYFLNVVVFKIWPDFYSFTFGGRYYLIPVSLLFMYAMTYMISYFETKIHNKKSTE